LLKTQVNRRNIKINLMGVKHNLEKTLIKSTIIMDLQEKLEQGNPTALQEFWDMVETNGAPLIEEIDGDLENALVTFIYKVEEEIENIVIVPPIGWKDFSGNRLERLLETNLWYINYKIKNDIRFNYFFSINDSFDSDWAKKNTIYDKLAKNILVFKGENREGASKSFAVMPNAPEHFWEKERNEVPKGNLYQHEFNSKHLEKGRRVRIYTPYGYEKTKQPYGFLLLTDGNEYINILSATTVLNNLIADKKIPPIVTIFIDSTETRGEELMCNDSFANLMVEELIPWTRGNYNITSKADESIIGGLSLGGLTASYLGLKHSEVFGNVLSQSGSYWYKPADFEGDEQNCWMSTQFKSIDKLPLKFYLNVGVLETKDRMIDTNLNLRDTLIEKGYTVDFEYFNSGHDYLSWGETLANGLISLIGV
jgi:enterochelin esterase-like enzyme